MTLQKKALGLVVLSIALTALTMGLISALSTLSRETAQAEAYRENLLAERKRQLMEYVEMGVNLIETLPEEEARRAVAALRYGERGYLWIHDYGNVMQVHPDKELVGKDHTEEKDVRGLRIIHELTRMCREKGEGFLDYLWKIPGEEGARPKTSFAKAVPSRQWVVATGLYMDDIDVAVAVEKANIHREVRATLLLHLWGTLGALLFLTLMTAFWVHRVLVRPIQTLTRVMRGFDNDLTLSVPVLSGDEVGELGVRFNGLIARLRDNIRMVADVTESLHLYAGGISSNMQQQSSLGVELASSVAEITSSIEELSSSAGQIAQHSQSVVTRTEQTLLDTRHGAGEVELLTEKMDTINRDMLVNLHEIVSLGKKSKEITKIMEIINDIANQTRLIAFNAALEAASAGEMGKRFGVVAVEIRRLADSVVASTAEIEGRITEILDSVNRLVMSSEKTASMMQEGHRASLETVTMLMDVVSGVEDCSDSARQISLSTQQQQIASSQILIAIKDINQGARDATASAQESSRVAEELTTMADQLKGLVGTFRLEACTHENRDSRSC